MEEKELIVRVSKIDLNNIFCKVIDHQKYGKGVVVGFSSITGQPYGYFYDHPELSAICFDFNEIIGGVKGRLRIDGDVWCAYD